MADKVSATITYLDSNQRKGMKAITDINPSADNGAVKTFCTGLNALTTNTVSAIEKIERTDITNVTAKPKLTLTLWNTNLIRLVTDGGGDLVFTQKNNLPNFSYKISGTHESLIAVSLSFIVDTTDSNSIHFMCYGNSNWLTSETEITTTFYFEETETTAATTAQLVMTKDNDPTLTIL